MNAYDFDGTIYAGDSTIDFYFFCLKKHPTIARFWPKMAVHSLRYKLGTGSKEKMKEAFFSYLSLIDAEKEVELFWDSHEKKIYDWYPPQKRADDVIISASPEFLLRPICDRLGLACLIGTRMDIRTGEIHGANCKGVEKVRRFKTETGCTKAEAFYSDSLTDLPMAEISDAAYFVKLGEVTVWEK